MTGKSILTVCFLCFKSAYEQHPLVRAAIDLPLEVVRSITDTIHPFSNRLEDEVEDSLPAFSFLNDPNQRKAFSALHGVLKDALKSELNALEAKLRSKETIVSEADKNAWLEQEALVEENIKERLQVS